MSEKGLTSHQHKIGYIETKYGIRTVNHLILYHAVVKVRIGLGVKGLGQSCPRVTFLGPDPTRPDPAKR